MSAAQELRTLKGEKIDWSIIAPFFWQWYHNHANDLILKRKVLILKITIRVRDLHPLFVQLFGPEPQNLSFIFPE